jgi:hypothetical protein
LILLKFFSLWSGADVAMKTGIAAGAGGAVLSEPVKAKAGSGAFLQQLENQRALKVWNFEPNFCSKSLDVICKIPC